VKEDCEDCLVAIHVDSPASNGSFASAAAAALSDPRASLDVDIVSFDYDVSNHPQSGAIGLFNKSQAVVGDLESYGYALLNQTGKPSMVVGFSVDSNDMDWSGADSSYAVLFDAIAQAQEGLVKAGITGIIYSPVRDADVSGLVDNSTGVGNTTGKFCEFEKAVQLVTATSPVAVFSDIPAQSPVQCTACSEEDILTGACSPNPTKQQLASQHSCDDGNPCEVCDSTGQNCHVPTDADNPPASGLRCPAGSVTGGCTLCADAPAGETYSCVYDYSNGSTDTETGAVNGLTTDAYSDIIAALPKPYKCCLAGGSGSNYSYSEASYQVPLNQPIVFSKTGDPNSQCGSGGTNDLTTAQSFCGYTLPVEQYDISCTVTPP